jgi:hypothetical protein
MFEFGKKKSKESPFKPGQQALHVAWSDNKVSTVKLLQYRIDEERGFMWIVEFPNGERKEVWEGILRVKGELA